MPSLRSFEKQTPKWGSRCRLIEGVACERRSGEKGPFRGRGYPGPCKEGWGRRVLQRGWTSAPRHRHGWEQPQERLIFVQTRGLQGTAGELPPAAPLAGLSHPSLGSAQERTEPRRRDQSSISKGGSQSLRVTAQVSCPWGAEGGGLWDPWAESPAT